MTQQKVSFDSKLFEIGKRAEWAVCGNNTFTISLRGNAYVGYEQIYMGYHAERGNQGNT